RVHELFERPGPAAKRMRLALALLDVEPDRVRDDLAGWMQQAADPAEVLLIRTALLPHAPQLRQRLWANVDAAATPPEQRFRALVALAAFDPNNARWKKAGGDVVEQLLSANPLHLGAWVEALAPVRDALLGPLGEAFRGTRLPRFRQEAATVLAGLLAD